MNIQQEIIRITSEYLKDTIDFEKLSIATREYKSLLNGLCEQNMDDERGRDDIGFENGKALGTYWAALCVDDMVRTRKFIRGIDKAIQDTLRKQKQLHILYAGTGPFATLILPFIFKYSKQEIQYTLLEINPLSFEILQEIFSKLDLKENHIQLVQDDATKYIIDKENKPDIIISETMQNALAKEQQVSIFLNLMNQVNFESLFIPEKIELSIGLLKEGISSYKKLAKVFEVSKEEMASIKQTDQNLNGEFSLGKKQTIIEKEALKGCLSFSLLTEIQVYKDEKIEVNESGLTTPLIIGDIPSNLKNSLTINTQYNISAHPELEYEITDPNWQ